MLPTGMMRGPLDPIRLQSLIRERKASAVGDNACAWRGWRGSASLELRRSPLQSMIVVRHGALLAPAVQHRDVDPSVEVAVLEGDAVGFVEEIAIEDHGPVGTVRDLHRAGAR